MLRDREAYEKEEAQRLASVAATSLGSAGRLFEEPPHRYRTCFQRDRDRVVHSRAFRRLEYKTQVFVYHEGDHYRNRLTHTIEGAQIARSVARCLRLNEELAEAVALAHDLGHTPFGHAGERVLAELMADSGGFDHNRQTLRIIDLLEERSPDYPGLNLCQETREGVLKHGAPWEHPLPLPKLAAQRSLEAQVADVADEIAYTNHDLDDGLQSGVLVEEDLAPLALWREARSGVPEGGSPAVTHARTIVQLINRLVTDLVESTAARVVASGVSSLAAVRAHSERLVGFSPEVEESKRELKRFLHARFYEHPRVLRMTRKAEWIVADLFRTYRENPQLLPPGPRRRMAADGRDRAVADYVAGMTDRFAMDEHRRLMDPHVPA